MDPTGISFVYGVLTGAGLLLLALRGWRWLDSHGYLDDDLPYESAPPRQHQRSHVKVIDGGEWP